MKYDSYAQNSVEAVGYFLPFTIANGDRAELVSFDVDRGAAGLAFGLGFDPVAAYISGTGLSLHVVVDGAVMATFKGQISTMLEPFSWPIAIGANSSVGLELENGSGADVVCEGYLRAAI